MVAVTAVTVTAVAITAAAATPVGTAAGVMASTRPRRGTGTQAPPTPPPTRRGGPSLRVPVP